MKRLLSIDCPMRTQPDASDHHSPTLVSANISTSIEIKTLNCADSSSHCSIVACSLLESIVRRHLARRCRTLESDVFTLHRDPLRTRHVMAPRGIGERKDNNGVRRTTCSSTPRVISRSRSDTRRCGPVGVTSTVRDWWECTMADIFGERWFRLEGNHSSDVEPTSLSKSRTFLVGSSRTSSEPGPTPWSRNTRGTSCDRSQRSTTGAA